MSKREKRKVERVNLKLSFNLPSAWSVAQAREYVYDTLSQSVLRPEGLRITLARTGYQYLDRPHMRDTSL
jgi:retron-type reverse transcriptase